MFVEGSANTVSKPVGMMGAKISDRGGASHKIVFLQKVKPLPLSPSQRFPLPDEGKPGREPPNPPAGNPTSQPTIHPSHESTVFVSCFVRWPGQRSTTTWSLEHQMSRSVHPTATQRGKQPNTLAQPQTAIKNMP